MSAAEAIKLVTDEDLINTTDHKALGNSSTSVGFCFAIAGKDEAAAMYRESKHLSGVTLLQVCLVGELWPHVKFKKSEGRYSSGVEKELCTTKYRLADFKSYRMYAPTQQSTLMPLFSGNWETAELITEMHYE